MFIVGATYCGYSYYGYILTKVPVLIVGESGGAACDIYNYCWPDSPSYLELPVAGEMRDAAYMEACYTYYGYTYYGVAVYVVACARLLPEIPRP